MKVGDLVQHRWYGSGEGSRNLFIGVITKAWRKDQHRNSENLYSIVWMDDRASPGKLIKEGELYLVSGG